MAIRNSSWSRFANAILPVEELGLRWLVIGSCTFLWLGCQTPSPHPSSVGEPSGQEISEGRAQHTPLTGAFPAAGKPKRVALILGPGGAKALAHVGVLRALIQQRIPIQKVIGLEWGALVGAIYASQGQIHDLEWKLYKMEQQNLPRPKHFFGKQLGDDSVKVMDNFLQDTFSQEDIKLAKIPFECPSRSVWTGLVVWQNRGPLKDAVRRCLPYPPLFKIQGGLVAGASQAAEAVELLRKEGYNVIIMVNVLGSALPVDQESLLDNLNYVILWQEVRRALDNIARTDIEVLNVDTSAYPMTQFTAKKELIRLGQAAGEKAASVWISKYGF